MLLCGVCFGEEDAPRHARVSVQYIEVPHAVLTELLGGEVTSGPALHAKAMEFSKTGEAMILETSVVVCRSGFKASAESVLEEIFPTEYQPPSLPCSFGNTYAVNPVMRYISAFETRNTGMTLQIELTVGDNPKIIDLRFDPEFVRRLRLETFLEHKDQWGDASRRMPVYEKWGTAASLILPSGKFELASVTTPKAQQPAPAPSRRILLFVRIDVIETP